MRGRVPKKPFSENPMKAVNMHKEHPATRSKKVSITTLGCKSNQYDSSAIEETLSLKDFEVVRFPSVADAYIINTCTVTGKTDYQSRQLVRRVRRMNPGAVVIVTGCYAEVSPDEVAGIEGVDYILGNPQKGKVAECILSGRRAGSPATLVGKASGSSPFTLRARGQASRTRANLKVQDGCSKGCAYCIIPRARGASRSLPLQEVEREIEILIQNGFREIILTGIHLGAYGEDLVEDGGIAPVLRLIEKKAYNARFRLSSLDPDEVTDEIIEILKTSERVCNHVHIPLQSGDAGVIGLMRRGYTASVFREKALRLHSSVPDISIGVDVIAGFPGEGDSEFGNTLSLLKDLPVSYMHIFPFSKRRGTPAASFRGQVDPRTVRERCATLKELDAAKRAAFFGSSVGKEAEVLIEEARDRRTGMPKGKSKNYITVLVEGPGVKAGEIVCCALSGVTPSGMTGERR